jgi:hypothetical protein
LLTTLLQRITFRQQSSEGARWFFHFVCRVQACAAASSRSKNASTISKISAVLCAW